MNPADADDIDSLLAAHKMAPSETRFSWNRDRLPALVLVLAVIFVYQPAWKAGFIWDDDFYVTGNPLLTAPDGLKRIWFSTDSPSQYFPMVYTMFRFERALWGLNPSGYHWVNILLHAANALLLWQLLRRLALPGAWLAAALFALHPVNVETVAWITERKNILSLFFSLLALFNWVAFVEDETRRRWRSFALCFLLYALALFSKTIACTLPAAMLLIVWLRRRPITLVRVAQTLPFLAWGVFMGLVSVWWEHHKQGTEGGMFAMSWAERSLVASKAIWLHAAHLVWPVHLAFSYPRWNISPADPRAYAWIGACVALAAMIFVTRRKVGRGVEAAIIYYVAALSPLLGFFMLYTFRYSFVADHYQYAACIGPLALLAAMITTAKINFPKQMLSGAMVVTLAFLTLQQAKVYQNSEILWETTSMRCPDSWFAHYNSGVALYAQGKAEEAITHWQKTIALKPDFANAYDNLGMAQFHRGQMTEAVANLQQAVKLQPDSAQAYGNLGILMAQQDKLDEAIGYFRKASELSPTDAQSHYNLARALMQKGSVDEAIVHFQKTVELKPEMVAAHNNLGRALLERGHPAEALAAYQKALAIQPGYAPAQDNLAWLLATCAEASLRNGKQALELALQLDQLAGNQDPEVLRTLAAAYAENGKFTEAIHTAEQALGMPAIASDPTLADQVRHELTFYRSGTAFHETMAEASVTKP